MNSEDSIIEGFFQKMKDQDKRIVITPVPASIYSQSKKQNWFPYSIAASLLLLAVSYVILQQPNKMADYTIHITLESGAVNTTQLLIGTDISIEEWESPTQSLIQDF